MCPALLMLTLLSILLMRVEMMIYVSSRVCISSENAQKDGADYKDG